MKKKKICTLLALFCLCEVKVSAQEITLEERHRLTAGLTFHVANKYFPTDIRLNYEKYWYPNHGTPKESEQDKLVAELMIRF